MSKLANLIADNANIPLRAAGELVDHLVRSVRALAEVDGTVRLPGLGTFRLEHKPERQGRNPRTGEAITIQAHTRMAFREGKAKT